MSLPSGYKRLEYIQSTGTQYINTGFKPNQNTKTVMEAQLISTGQSYPAPFGANQNDTNSFYVFLLSSTKWAANFNNARYQVNGGEIQKCVFTLDSSAYTVNSSSVQISQGAFQSAYNLFLFGINQIGEFSNTAAMKMYSCQIYDNGNLIRDYIPCQNPDGTIGLWDDVNSVFYTNAGTGTFTSGSVVDPYGNDENTLLLLHGDDLTDSSPYGVAITNNGVSISNAQSKFGGKSMYFNGKSFLTLLDKALVPSSGDFTFDWWEYRTTVGSEGAVFHQNYGEKTGYGFLIGYILSGSLDLFISSAGSSWDVASMISMGTILTNQWVHRAIVRNGSKFSIYQNGSLVSSFTSSKTITVNMYPTLGSYEFSTNTYFSGYIDEFRISNVARWTEDFTPPTKPYSSSLNLPVNIGGAWKEANEVFVNIGGIWKTVKDAFVNIGGAWKKIG